VVAVAVAAAGAAEAVAVAEAAPVARDAAAVAVCPGVLAASADQTSRLRCQSQVIMAGLDNIDPAVLCLDGIASRARRRPRLTVERVFDFVDKCQHAG
jgi:hypothetical protein